MEAVRWSRGALGRGDALRPATGDLILLADASLAAGVPLQASWLTWPPNETDEEPSADAWARHAETCLIEAANCDILLLCMHNGENHFGSLLEAGAALGAGKMVYLCEQE